MMITINNATNATNTAKTTKVATHAGVFHLDDVASAALLALLFDSIEVERVKEITSDYDVIFDVGGGKFDHHQQDAEWRVDEEGNKTFKYAAVGLLWRKYGKQLLQKIGALDVDEAINEAWKLIDEGFIAGIDYADNARQKDLRPEDGALPLNIAVKQFIPGDGEMTTMDEAFNAAVQFILPLMRRVIEKAISDATAITTTKMEIAAAEERGDSFVVMTKYHFSWKSLITETSSVKWGITKTPRGDYSAQQIKMPFPEDWRGLERENLQQKTGVADAIFCHPNGFMASARTLHGAIALTEKAMATV